MTRQDLENKIIELVADKLGISNSEITMEADFRRDLSADSLDVSELIMSLENEFSIRVPESDMVNLKTVGNVVDYIEKVINLQNVSIIDMSYRFNPSKKQKQIKK